MELVAREHNEATSDGWDKFKFFAKMGVAIGCKISENYVQYKLGMEQINHGLPVPGPILISYPYSQLPAARSLGHADSPLDSIMGLGLCSGETKTHTA